MSTKKQIKILVVEDSDPLSLSKMYAREIVKVYNENVDRDDFVKVLVKRDIKESDAKMYWDIIDATIESEAP